MAKGKQGRLGFEPANGAEYPSFRSFNLEMAFLGEEGLMGPPVEDPISELAGRGGAEAPQLLAGAAGGRSRVGGGEEEEEGRVPWWDRSVGEVAVPRRLVGRCMWGSCGPRCCSGMGCRVRNELLG